MSDRLDSIAPLGRDSVPLVYISCSGSSSATATSGSSAGPSAHHSATSDQPGRGAAPIQPRTPSPQSASFNACSATSARASSTTRWRASACPRMNATSSAVSMKLIGTRIRPSLAAASVTTAYSQQLCASRASRSPLTRPRVVSAAHIRFTDALYSAKVCRWVAGDQRRACPDGGRRCGAAGRRARAGAPRSIGEVTSAPGRGRRSPGRAAAAVNRVAAGALGAPRSRRRPARCAQSAHVVPPGAGFACVADLNQVSASVPRSPSM